MTLGGLALAVGILVDEATVTIENMHTHMAEGRNLARAALDAAHDTSVPRLLAMLCVLAIFIPSFFMVGAAKALFVPLSLAVGFSMLASFLLSSTLVPILSIWVLRGHGEVKDSAAMERLRGRYGHLASSLVRYSWMTLVVYVALSAVAIAVLLPRVGAEIFPKSEAGQLQLRLRAPSGTRVERTEAIALQMLEIIKRQAGPANIEITSGFVGVHAPSYPINLVYLWNGGPEEGVLQVQFKSAAHLRMAELRESLRQSFARELPDVNVSFEPSDILSRVMSLGAPTPIEVAVSGPSLPANRQFAERIKAKLAELPALRDLQFGQSLDYPTIDVTLNRERAGMLGVNTAEASRSLVAGTASSRFTTPVYWADPNSGVAYQVQVQVPAARLSSLEELKNLPVTFHKDQSILLRNIASITHGVTVGQYQRYNMQRLVTVTANIEQQDLGRVGHQVGEALRQLGAPPEKVNVAVRGQLVPMQQMLDGLRTGVLLAIVVVFLLLTANFQSVKLSLIVISSVPAVLAGVLVLLWLTRTTLNIQSFMGAIMAIGVAVANAILLVTFAERERQSGAESDRAAVLGAQSRFRAILMTSVAMIAGMTPMAIGLGDGGEQTAALGRAVIGGLAAATLATLLVLPAVFALVRARASRQSASLHPEEAEEALGPLRRPNPSAS